MKRILFVLFIITPYLTIAQIPVMQWNFEKIRNRYCIENLSNIQDTVEGNYEEAPGISGKGRATDNIWIERFWKSLKYNYIYLNPCDNGLELFEGVLNHIEYYNQKKHQTIKKTPNEAYQESITKKAA